VAQAELSLASAPVLTSQGLESRHSLLRTFAVARRDSYVVMPGGLTRTEGADTAALISNQAGAVTKDTWVLASEPEPLGAFWLHSGPAVEGIDPMSSIPSHAAESLWWLGRYAERAESQTRLVRAVIDRTNEFAGASNPAGTATLQALQRALLLSSGQQATLEQPLRAMLDNAYAVSDQLSRDTWLVIGPLERILTELEIPMEEPGGYGQAALQQVMQSLLAMAGLGVESMVRDLGWRFMDAGRRIERSIQLLALMQATLEQAQGTAADSLILESVLSAAESIITYRFRYRSQAQLETVLDLLLLDAGNPRSLAYQLSLLTADLDALPPREEARLRPEQRLVLEATTALRLADPARLILEDSGGFRPALAELLASVSGSLLGAANQLDVIHFRQTAPTFSLLGPAGAEPSYGGGR
jgi:uncharacterized alpha-E superfamily protein